MPIARRHFLGGAAGASAGLLSGCASPLTTPAAAAPAAGAPLASAPRPFLIGRTSQAVIAKGMVEDIFA